MSESASRDHARTPRRIRHYLMGASSIFLGTIIAVLLVEIILRIWNPFPFRVKGDTIVLPINQEYRMSVPAGDGSRRLVVHKKNSLGFRGPEPPSDAAQRLTIIAVGGSTTECFYLSEGATWPDQLAVRLAPTFPKLWVNNAGLDGHSTFGHLVLLQDHVLRLRPKVVILLVGINDIGVDHPRVYDRNHLATGIEISSWRSFVVSLANASEFAGLALNLYRVWKARDMGVMHTFDYSLAERPTAAATDDEIDEAVDYHRSAFLPAYQDRLTLLAQIIRQADAIPVLLTQPARFRPAAGNAGKEWRILELYNDVVRRLADETDVRVIDLARELPRDVTYFYDDIHFSEKGAAAVGTLVASRLCSVLRDRFGSQAAGGCG